MNKIKCMACGKQDLDKDIIGINKKLLGRNITNFHCMDCLADYLEVTTEELEDMIKEFREQGCNLFG